MALFFRPVFPHWWRKSAAVFLALSWLAGLMLGVVLFVHTDGCFSSLMRGALDDTVSIVVRISVAVLPFLFSAFAVYIFKPGLLLPVCFLKAFAFSFVSVGVLSSFGSGGWALRWLLMFTDILSLPVLYFYWRQHISGDVCFSGSGTFFMLSLLILIGCIDCCCISPFLAGLIS